MAVQLTNNAVSTLAGAITDSATQLSVQSGDGAKFPQLSSDGEDWFPVVVVDSSANREIMRCTAISGDTLTVARGEEGTTAIAFAAGSSIGLRLTAAAVADIQSYGAGADAPEAPQQYQLWADTSVADTITMQQYVGTDWIALWSIDTGTGATIVANTGMWTVAGGTHDAITATYDPPLTALSDGQLCQVRMGYANLTTTPTFNPNGLGADIITKNGGQALAPGDIPGDLAEIALRYNAANTRWELLNPPSVPVGGMVPYFGGTIPAGFALPQGQNLSAATYPAANAVLGTTYGNPGGGNFTMPDLRSRFFFNIDSTSSPAGLITATGDGDGQTLGTTGGAQNVILVQAQLPNITLSTTIASGQGSHLHLASNGAGFYANNNGSNNIEVAGGSNLASVSSTAAATLPAMSGTTPLGGSEEAVPTLPPCMGINCMMRIV